ncbi:carbohydrate-binding protein [Agrobacterium salinitolerans]
MQTLNKYNDLGRPLTTSEVDGNWDVITTAITALENGGLPIVGINLLENESGAFLQFVDAEGGSVAEIPFPAGLQTAGAWTSGAAYTTRDIVTFEGGTFLCAIGHTASGADIWTDLDAGRWLQLGSAAAESIEFVPGSSGLSSDTMQEVILELLGMIQGSSLVAVNVAYNNTASGLSSTFVQGALDEIVGKVATLGEAIGSGGGGSGSDDQTAAEVPFTPVDGTAATNVQAALADAFEAIGDLQADGGTVYADEVTFSASGWTATNVEDALIEVKGLIGYGGGGSDDQTAAEVPFTPVTGTAATNVQAALADAFEAIGGFGGGGGGGGTAEDVTYDSTADTYLSGQTSVQGALSRADSELVQLHADISAVADTIDTLDANGISASGIGSYSKVYDALIDLLSRVEALENA